MIGTPISLFWTLREPLADLSAIKSEIPCTQAGTLDISQCIQAVLIENVTVGQQSYVTFCVKWHLFGRCLAGVRGDRQCIRNGRETGNCCYV